MGIPIMGLMESKKGGLVQGSDGYVNATHMAKANNVLINDWSRLATTQAYTQELSIITGIPVMDLMVSKKRRI